MMIEGEVMICCMRNKHKEVVLAAWSAARILEFVNHMDMAKQITSWLSLIVQVKTVGLCNYISFDDCCLT